MTPIRDLVELTKPRVNVMVALTTLVGALMVPDGKGDALSIAVTVLGTYVLASAAAVFNMVLEERSDALMPRTAGRPLPTGRVTRRQALLVGLALTVGGLLMLAFGVNLLTAALGLATLASYLLVYTPLKVITPWSTHIGAVPGALPIVMGWSGAAIARGPLEPSHLGAEFSSLGIGPWLLFAILFFWQLPHFFAIAWRYRLDYAAGGLAMLSVGDEEGRRTSAESLVFTVALVLSSVTPWMVGMVGVVYLAGAVLLGIGFLYFAVRFRLECSEPRARALMLFSILYLPAVMLLLVLDRVP